MFIWVEFKKRLEMLLNAYFLGLKIKSQKVVLTNGGSINYSKIVVCVEGENDRNFLLNINQAIQEFKDIVDLRDISIIPLHGGNLKQWVDRNYLGGSSVVEFHLYDRDADNKYKSEIDKVNSRTGCFGVLTKLREMENYIHWELINSHFKTTIETTDWANKDVPAILLSIVKDKTDTAIKQILNGSLTKKMTKKHLEEIGVYEEVLGWFSKIAEMHNVSLKP